MTKLEDIIPEPIDLSGLRAAPTPQAYRVVVSVHVSVERPKTLQRLHEHSVRDERTAYGADPGIRDTMASLVGSVVNESLDQSHAAVAALAKREAREAAE